MCSNRYHGDAEFREVGLEKPISTGRLTFATAALEQRSALTPGVCPRLHFFHPPAQKAKGLSRFVSLCQSRRSSAELQKVPYV
jgi:hypothetical protein